MVLRFARRTVSLRCPVALRLTTTGLCSSCSNSGVDSGIGVGGVKHRARLRPPDRRVIPHGGESDGHARRPDRLPARDRRLRGLSRMDTLRWGILSTADIARTKVVPGMQKARRGTIVAVASRDAWRPEAVASELRIPQAHASY